MLSQTLTVVCLSSSVGGFRQLIEQQHGRLVVLAMRMLGSQ